MALTINLPFTKVAVNKPQDGIQNVQTWATGLTRSPDRKVAALLALIGVVAPVSGLHKFYLRQPLWGLVYLMLCWTPIPRVASLIEGVWYLFQTAEAFDRRFNQIPVTPASSPSTVDPSQVSAIVDALRQLDQLRMDGLLSEYEFEQKRRQLLDRIA